MRRRKSGAQRQETRPRMVGYVRVSTEEQAREGVSLEAQRSRIEAYCVAQGYELVALERDNGISGKIPPTRRPGLARALQRVRSGEADGILAVKLDRISRSTRDVLDLADAANREGWQLVSLSEGLDTTKATGRFTLTILAALAQLEREQISERVGEALDHVARQGRARSRFTPFGWRNADGGDTGRPGDRRRLVPHAAEQAALRRMVELREAGSGARRIAAALNLESPNPRSGRLWAPEGVATILRRLDRWSKAGVEPMAAS